MLGQLVKPPGAPGVLAPVYLCVGTDGVTAERGRELAQHALCPRQVGVRVSCSSLSPAITPCYQRKGEQMVGSGLALPRRLAAKRWRQDGAKEMQSISAQGCMCVYVCVY